MAISALSLFIARRRLLQRALGWLLPETATFKVIDEIRIEIPLHDRTGPAFYLNRGGPQAFYHYEEAEKIEVLRAMPPEGVFLDIGANIGLFSAYIAKTLPVSSCHAFEPNPLLAGCIRKTARQSPFPGIRVEEVCLGDQTGPVDLFLHKVNFGGATMDRANVSEDQRGRAVKVECTTLDRWVEMNGLKRLDVMKVDVQGAEAQVLKGGAATIARFRPTLVIEMENRELTDAGSELRRILDSGLFGGYRLRLAGSGSTGDVAVLADLAATELSKGHLQSNYVLFYEG